MFCKKIFTIAYKMNDAEYEGDGTAYFEHVLASNYENAIKAIKDKFVNVRPRKFSNFTVLEEHDIISLTKEKIIGYPQFYLGFEDDDDMENEKIQDIQMEFEDFKTAKYGAGKDEIWEPSDDEDLLYLAICCSRCLSNLSIEYSPCLPFRMQNPYRFMCGDFKEKT